jgi:hypothetical protein
MENENKELELKTYLESTDRFIYIDPIKEKYHAQRHKMGGDIKQKKLNNYYILFVIIGILLAGVLSFYRLCEDGWLKFVEEWVDFNITRWNDIK